MDVLRYEAMVITVSDGRCKTILDVRGRREPKGCMCRTHQEELGSTSTRAVDLIKVR